MLRILLLELDDTLVDGEVVKPHAREALPVLAALPAGDQPLAVGLVSDSLRPGPPAPVEVPFDAGFDDYLARLDRLGLRASFEPVHQRVTLSTHAGARMPDRRIFERAVARLGRGEPLGACLFLSEDAAHVTAARALGLTALQFGAAFSSWAEGPLVVATQLGLRRGPGLEAALAFYLLRAHHAELLALGREGDAPQFVASIKRPHPVSGHGLGALDGVLVELPSRATLRLDPTGRVIGFTFAAPEAAGHLTLRRRGAGVGSR